MKKLALVSVLAASLAACGSGSDDDGVSGGDYSREYEAGDTSAKVTAGGDIEVELPNGFETYPGSKVITTMTINNPAVQGKTVAMETDDGIQEVADFYKGKAKDAGLEINMETASADAIMLVGQVEGEGGFNMVASRNDEGKTTIQLTVSEAGDGEGS